MMKKSGAQMDSNWPTANAMGGSCNLRMLLQSLTPAVSRTGARSAEGTNKRSLLVSA